MLRTDFRTQWRADEVIVNHLLLLYNEVASKFLFLVPSNNPSQLVKNIKEGFEQVGDGGTVAIYVPNRDRKSQDTINFINSGYQEASRKGNVRGFVEVWFDDKVRIELGRRQ